MNPIAHTAQTTTNQIRQPMAMTVRSIETSFVSVLRANARMRENVCQVVVLRGGMFLGARRCAEFGSSNNTCRR